MAETVVVTGGAGFIGSHVADRFLAEGWDVTILDDLSSGREENIPSSARFVRGDITTSWIPCTTRPATSSVRSI